VLRFGNGRRRESKWIGLNVGFVIRGEISCSSDDERPSFLTEGLRRAWTSCHICNIVWKNRPVGLPEALSALRADAAWIWSWVRMAGNCCSCWP